MGQFAAIAPYVAAAVAAGASYVNTRNYNKAVDTNLAQGIRTRGKRQDEANKRVRDQITETQNSNPEDERKNLLAGYMKQLLAGKGQANAGLGQIAGASTGFNNDVVNASLGVEQQGAKEAGLTARLDAPMLQRRGEQRGIADAASDLNVIGFKSRSEDYINEIKRRAIQRNPWLDVLAKVAGAYAGMAGGAGAGALAGAGNVKSSEGTSKLGDTGGVFGYGELFGG